MTGLIFSLQVVEPSWVCKPSAGFHETEPLQGCGNGQLPLHHSEAPMAKGTQGLYGALKTLNVLEFYFQNSRR